MPLSAIFQLLSWRPVLVVEETGVPGENHRPWASNWQTLSLAAASLVHPFCNLQSRTRTPACRILVIGLYELLGNPTTWLIVPPWASIVYVQRKRHIIIYEKVLMIQKGQSRVVNWRRRVSERVSEWANSAIFQLYNDENKLIVNEMIMSSALF
jgi:hypothetical protein